MNKYLKTKEGSIEDVVKQMQNKVMENDYQDKFKKALDKEGKPLGQMTGAEKKSFFNKVDKMHKGKNESLDSKDKPTVKDVIGQLKGAVKAHGKQAKDLEKAMKTESVNETHTTQTAKANAQQRAAGGEKSPISLMKNKSIDEITANNGKTFAQMRAEIDEACWDSHKQVGFKMKGGKRVPNCVPKGANEEVKEEDKKEDKKEQEAGTDTRDQKKKTMTGQVATSPEMNPKVDYKY